MWKLEWYVVVHVTTLHLIEMNEYYQCVILIGLRHLRRLDFPSLARKAGVKYIVIRSVSPQQRRNKIAHLSRYGVLYSIRFNGKSITNINAKGRHSAGQGLTCRRDYIVSLIAMFWSSQRGMIVCLSGRLNFGSWCQIIAQNLPCFIFVSRTCYCTMDGWGIKMH